MKTSLQQRRIPKLLTVQAGLKGMPGKRVLLPVMLIGLLLLMFTAGCSTAGQGSGTPPVAGTAPTDLAPSSSALAEISPTPAPDLPVKVISQAMVTDVNGHFHLVGEIRNGSRAGGGTGEPDPRGHRCRRCQPASLGLRRSCV